MKEANMWEEKVVIRLCFLRLVLEIGGGGANRGTGSDTDDATAREIAIRQVSLRYAHA